MSNEEIQIVFEYDFIQIFAGFDKDTRAVKPGCYSEPPQNIFQISLCFQLAM